MQLSQKPLADSVQAMKYVNFPTSERPRLYPVWHQQQIILYALLL